MESATKDRIDRVVTYVVDRASQLLDVERVWLFGSQALGTATPRSDVDLAFRLLPGSRERWAGFVLECEEEVPALIDLDLVDDQARALRSANRLSRAIPPPARARR